MEKNEIELLETVILLLDGGRIEILENCLLPYLSKAREIVSIIKK